jgi:hypothetical protein
MKRHERMLSETKGEGFACDWFVPRLMGWEVDGNEGRRLCAIEDADGTGLGA